jgi:DnaK suppressor protein
LNVKEEKTMTTRQLDTFKKALSVMEAEITARIQRIRENPPVDECGDPLDRLRAAAECDLLASDLAVQFRILKGVCEALREIGVGTFGRCASCDGRIPLRRLQAVPWSAFCVTCQEAEELRSTMQQDPMECYAKPS